MISGIALALLAFLLSAPAPRKPDGELRRLYEQGDPFERFVERARSRRDQWRGHFESAEVPAPLLERARAVGGTWRLLVVAEDWCGDSVNTIPYVAALAARLDGIELRIVDSRAGRAVMEAHRTPDGRPATPTVLVLDQAWQEAGCFVERPPALMDWYQANRGALTSEELHDRIFAWYAEDAGAGTLEEIVRLLEDARAGRPRCPSGAGTARGAEPLPSPLQELPNPT